MKRHALARKIIPATGLLVGLTMATAIFVPIASAQTPNINTNNSAMVGLDALANILERVEDIQSKIVDIVGSFTTAPWTLNQGSSISTTSLSSLDQSWNSINLNWNNLMNELTNGNQNR